MSILFALVMTAYAQGSLIDEGMRQFSLMRTSRYQHDTEVNEDRGRFDYDCSGFVGYAIKRVAPEAFRELPISRPRDARPLAKDFHAFFSGLNAPSKRWSSVVSARDLQPGDIIAWLKPDDIHSENTGHVMLVAEAPRENPARASELLVKVMDSSRTGHAADTRKRPRTGLGHGVIGILTDADGKPVAYRWRGGLSKKVEVTPIAFGRLK